jgi:hypothetical protein
MIHKEGLCPSNVDINRLMMMMIYKCHSRFIPEEIAGTSEKGNHIPPTLYQNDVTMRNTADVISDKPIAHSLLIKIHLECECIEERKR